MCPVFGSELSDRRADVLVDSSLADGQNLADGESGIPLRHQRENLALAGT